MPGLCVLVTLPAQRECGPTHSANWSECEVDRQGAPDCAGRPAAAGTACPLRLHHGLAHCRGAAPGRGGPAGGQLPVCRPAPGLAAGRLGHLRRPGRVHGPRQSGGCVCACGHAQARRHAGRAPRGGTPLAASLLHSPTALSAELCGLSTGEVPQLPEAGAKVRCRPGCSGGLAGALAVVSGPQALWHLVNSALTPQ